MEATAQTRLGTWTNHFPHEWLLALAIVLAVAGLSLIARGSGYLGGSLVLGAVLVGIEGRPALTQPRS
jgi:hypothetical protein